MHLPGRRGSQKYATGQQAKTSTKKPEIKNMTLMMIMAKVNVLNRGVVNMRRYRNRMERLMKNTQGKYKSPAT